MYVSTDYSSQATRAHATARPVTTVTVAPLIDLAIHLQIVTIIVDSIPNYCCQ